MNSETKALIREKAERQLEALGPLPVDSWSDFNGKRLIGALSDLDDLHTECFLLGYLLAKEKYAPVQEEMAL